VRDDVDREAHALGQVLDLVDGQRDAVERHRALGCEVGSDFLPSDDREARGAAHPECALHLADPIDMASDDMATKLVADAKRALQVEAPALLPHAGSGSAQRLARNIDGEPVLALFDHRQTDAGAGDGGTKVHAGHVIAAADPEVEVPPAAHGLDPADISDDPGKHQRTRS
jgi:hypothetical protein